jgi:hypothetical protein
MLETLPILLIGLIYLVGAIFLYRHTPAEPRSIIIGLLLFWWLKSLQLSNLEAWIGAIFGVIIFWPKKKAFQTKTTTVAVETTGLRIVGAFISTIMMIIGLALAYMSIVGFDDRGDNWLLGAAVGILVAGGGFLLHRALQGRSAQS